MPLGIGGELQLGPGQLGGFQGGRLGKAGQHSGPGAVSLQHEPQGPGLPRAWGRRTSRLLGSCVAGVPRGLELLHQGQQLGGQGQGLGAVGIRPDQHRPAAGGQGVAKSNPQGRLALAACPGFKSQGLVLAGADQQGPLLQRQSLAWG